MALLVAIRIFFFALGMGGAIVTGLIWARLIPVNGARPPALFRLPESVLVGACAAGCLWLGSGPLGTLAAGLPLTIAAYCAQRMAMGAFRLSVHGATLEPPGREREWPAFRDETRNEPWRASLPRGGSVSAAMSRRPSSDADLGANRSVG